VELAQELKAMQVPHREDLLHGSARILRWT
jgi:hypothetical protein